MEQTVASPRFDSDGICWHLHVAEQSRVISAIKASFAVTPATLQCILEIDGGRGGGTSEHASLVLNGGIPFCKVRGFISNRLFPLSESRYPVLSRLFPTPEGPIVLMLPLPKFLKWRNKSARWRVCHRCVSACNKISIGPRRERHLWRLQPFNADYGKT